MTTMVDDRPDTDHAGAAGDPPPAGFTPYRYGEDYPDDGAGLCWDFIVVADRVFVCVRPDHHRRYRLRNHGYIRMYRNPDVTFSSIAKSLEDDDDLP